MTGGEATRYRAMIARCNFLCCDRPDVPVSRVVMDKHLAALGCRVVPSDLCRRGAGSEGGVDMCTDAHVQGTVRASHVHSCI